MNVSLQLSSSNNNNNNNENEEVTYFSPNVELGQDRYDLKENHDTTTTTTVTTSNTNEYSFFDEAVVYVRAGSGGQGGSTFERGVGGQNGHPDGGDGGRGGDVVLIRDDSLNTLAGLTNAWRPNSFGGSGRAYTSGGSSSSSNTMMSFRSENGADGSRSYKSGKSAPDTRVFVPPGTLVQEEIPIYDYDQESGEDVWTGEYDYVDLGSIDPVRPKGSSSDDTSSTLVVAKGGAGGEGSHVTGKGAGRGVRRTRASPEGGERRRIKLTLKIVADVALVGVPNAGKSTFLAAVTRAKPKIANYPFTTVIPNLGVWVPPSISSSPDNSGRTGLVLCDVPGLIAGAAQGVGLGHAFLRHVERCHVILHLVDATSVDPLADFHMLNREIVRYGNGKLGRMPQIVVVNKVDVWEEEEDDNNKNKNKKEDWEKGLQTKMSREELDQALREGMTHSRLMYMSAKGKDGVDDLMERMATFVQKVKQAEAV